MNVWKGKHFERNVRNNDVMRNKGDRKNASALT